MKYIQRMIIILAVCALLYGCGDSQADSPTTGNAVVQVEVGKEIKISADGKVSAGDQVLSEGGAGSLATGCDITVKPDGTMVISTKKGDFSVCKDYSLTVPAQTAVVVRVSTPAGQTLTVSGSGFAVGQMMITETGVVETPQGTIAKQEDTVVFSTSDGNYIIFPDAAALQRSGIQAAACQVETPGGEVLQVREPLPILGNKATILPDGTVETAEGKVSMLQQIPTITTEGGEYTFSQEETVIVAETTVILPVAVLNPAGDVISTGGKTVIEEGVIVVQEDGSLVTCCGTVCVEGGNVTVKPLDAQRKTMILPNGDIIDITDAQILEDGSALFPAAENNGMISAEMRYSPNGFLTEYFYFRATEYPEGGLEYHAVLKDDPSATHVETFRYDLHYLSQPLLERKMTELATGNVVYGSSTVLDGKGNIIEKEELSENERFVTKYDAFGREIYRATYLEAKDWFDIYETTYWVESAQDRRIASITYYENGEKRSVDQYDEKGQLAIRVFYVGGQESGSSYYQDGKLAQTQSVQGDGSRVVEVYNANGTKTQTTYNTNGTRREIVFDAQARMLRDQFWSADGTSESYYEYLYDVDGWDTVLRLHRLTPFVVSDQSGVIHTRLVIQETCENNDQRKVTEYKEDGSVYNKFVTDKQKNISYTYGEEYGGRLLTGMTVNKADGTASLIETYRYDANGVLTSKEVYDYANNRYSRYDGAGNLLETFSIAS